MSKRAIFFVVLVAIAAGAVVSIKPWQAEQSTPPLVLYGNVDVRELQLAFRVSGRISEMLLDEGDRVAPGDLVATLDDQPLRDAYAVSEARVVEARARLDALLSGSRKQEVGQARAMVREAEAAARKAQQDLDRQNQLLPAGVSSQRQVDAAAAAHKQAVARVVASRETLALLVEGPRAEDIAAAEAAVTAAEALLAQVQTQLDDTRLFAPSAGTIMTRTREPGAMLAAGQALYVLSLDDKVYVRAYVAGPSLGRVVPGTEVSIRSDSSDRVYAGQVGFVSPRAEFTPKTVETPELRSDLVYRLRIVVSNADQALRQGMPVTVEF